MTQPIIAISAGSLNKFSKITNHNFAQFAPKELKEAVIAAGGIPIILPFPEKSEQASELAKRAVGLFDGLIFPGGPDIDPTFYHEVTTAETGHTNVAQDTYEIILAQKAKKAGKQIFGICRGMQLINVAFGGNLYQDLETQKVGEKLLQHQQSLPVEFPSHDVDFVKTSEFYKIFGEKAQVNSRHHQGLKDVASGFTVVAQAGDGVIEAIESTDGLAAAVQWHPENMWHTDKKQLALFEKFVEKAAHQS